MDIEDIETFLMLVRTRNVSKTAEKLYVSQPTVSHRLKLLEEELGTSLVLRGRGYKKIELTPKGEAFVGIAHRYLSLMGEMRALRHGEERIHLRIGSTNSMNATILSGLYRRLLKIPDLSLSLKISSHYSYEIYELLENYIIDIGFVYHNLPFKSILSRPILREKMYLVQAKEGAIRKEKIALEELRTEHEIYFVWETGYQIWHEQQISKGQIPHIEADTYALLSELIDAPRKWAICPQSVMEELSRHHAIIVSEIESPVPPPERITYAIRSKESNETKSKALDSLEAQMHAYFIERQWISA